ncbi:MAG: class I SAM-dependent methyltransferase [Candidatus Methanomethyliaceae archaeon]
MPTPDELAELYKSSWHEPNKNPCETGGTTRPLAAIYARKLAASLGLKDFSGKVILDFGAGMGEMLAAVEELGGEVYAVEPFGCQYLAERGFRVFRSLEDIPPCLRFDGVIAMDVVEHLESPWEQLREIRGVLKDPGWLYVATVNAWCLNARLSRAGWREARRPGHLVFFTLRTLEKILAEAGFERLRRLRWFLGYNRGCIHTAVHYILQLFRLDGALRYIAWKGL